MLQDVDVTPGDDSLPVEVTLIVEASSLRLRRLLGCDQESHLPGFVPSDSELVFRNLRALAESGSLAGNAFCELGSGYGTATCLATTLGLEAFGIEIESRLVEAARGLAQDFRLPAKFVQGSFVPSDGNALLEEAYVDNNGRYPWLRNRAENAYEKLGRGLDSFDVVFAYPWPGEEYFIEQLFTERAHPGAVLLVCSDNGPITARRKVIRTLN